MKSFFLAFALVMPLSAFSSYNYAECRCSVDFQTPSGDVITVSDYVYCPSSEEYNFTCSGSVIGNSLDTICENGKGETTKSPNWSAPSGSKEVFHTLKCSL